MRTTVDLDDELLAQLKARAAEQRRSMTSLVEDAIRQMLARSERPAKRRRIRLKTVGGDGVMPGVDLSDNAALLDVMEER